MPTERTDEPRDPLKRSDEQPLQAENDDRHWDVTDAYVAQSQAAGATGWDDPEMDVYDSYDAHGIENNASTG